MATRGEKLEISVAARISESKFRTLDRWCETSSRKRSEVLRLIIERILDLYEIEQRNGMGEPVELFVRRVSLQ